MLTIASVTPTLCELLEVPLPRSCSAPGFDLGFSRRAGSRVEKALVFAADAIGTGLVDEYASEFSPVRTHAPVRVDAHAVMPSVTPVCFASMFTGAPPETHGIQRYEKPVLACDTLFDACARARRPVAIVAVADSSIDRIFRGRAIDYFSERDDAGAEQRAHALLAENRHDLIVVYQQEYDDRMHASTPRRDGALAAMRNHVRSFDALAHAARTRWSGVAHALVFVTDHGTHVDPETGRGAHGTDLPDDLEVSLFWGVFPATSRPAARTWPPACGTPDTRCP